MKSLLLIHGGKTTAVFMQSAVCKIKNVEKSVGLHSLGKIELFGERTLYSSDFSNAKENMTNISARHAE